MDHRLFPAKSDASPEIGRGGDGRDPPEVGRRKEDAGQFPRVRGLPENIVSVMKAGSIPAAERVRLCGAIPAPICQRPGASGPTGPGRRPARVPLSQESATSATARPLPPLSVRAIADKSGRVPPGAIASRPGAVNGHEAPGGHAPTRPFAFSFGPQPGGPESLSPSLFAPSPDCPHPDAARRSMRTCHT
jgi:hypothetical protein